MILDPNTNKFIHFGSLAYEDLTEHHDLQRQKVYIARAIKIRGNWKKNEYSPNNLSLYLLRDYNPNNSKFKAD